MRSVQILQYGYIGPLMVSPTDGVIDGVPDELAWEAVAIGLASYADGDGPKPDQESGLTIDDLQSEVVEEIPDDGTVKRPYGNATKSAWISYALTVDPELTEEAATGMSKVQLMSAYGERL
jgi:hypothetical protein